MAKITPADIATILQTNEKNALRRMLAMRLGETCIRCGGSGNYSYNQMHGTTCYGCGGWGQSAKLTSAVVERCKVAVADGSLAAYLLSLQCRARCKKATERVLAAWHATGVEKRYNWRNSYKCAHNPNYSPKCEMIAETINKPMHDAYQVVAGLVMKTPGRKAPLAEMVAYWAALDAAVTEALRVIADRKAALDAIP